MKTFNFTVTNKETILALGAESAGNFSVFKNGILHFSEDFGDLLDEKNWNEFQKAILGFLKKNKLRPDIILADLHPLFKTTAWGQDLAKKYSAKFIQIQHHEAHIFSSIGDSLLPLYLGGDVRYSGQRGFRTNPNTIYAITMDGTGLGTDEKIWGGEVFKVTSNPSPPVLKGRCPDVLVGTGGVYIERIGHLENQILLGGEIAIREPARVLLGILNKLIKKEEIYPFVKKFYSKNEFELLYNQLQNNFNCLETSSTGRVLDAVSVLLGFSKNERKEKHGPTYALEKNSTIPYLDLKPKITKDATGQYILDTSYVINYVISALGGSASGGNYLHKKDKKRLAATVQLYLAEGLHEIIQKDNTLPLPLYSGGDVPTYSSGQRGFRTLPIIFFSGGLAQNKIISNYLESRGAYAAKTIPPGDAGLSFGQVVWQLFW